MISANSIAIDMIKPQPSKHRTHTSGTVAEWFIGRIGAIPAVAALQTDLRIAFAGALPLLIPVLLYPGLGTLHDMMSIIPVLGLMCLLGLLDQRMASGHERLAVLLGICAALVLALIHPAVGLSLLLVGFLRLVGRKLPRQLQNAAPFFDIAATVLIVDLACTMLAFERSLGLLAAVASVQGLIMLCKADCELQDMRYLVAGASMTCCSIASYLFLLHTDPVIMQYLGSSVLVSVPFMMMACLRVFQRRFVEGVSAPDGLSLLSDRWVAASIIGWCLMMSLLEAFPASL